MEAPSLSLIISALPALAAMIKALFPEGDRGLARRLRRVTAAHEAMPDCEGKRRLQETASRLAAELAYREDRDARRRVDGVSVATVVIVALVAGGATFGLWATGSVALRVLGVAIALFAALLILAGVTQSLVKVEDRYAFERDPLGGNGEE